VDSQKTVLVTGSDGFLGRHLVPYLASLGYEVIAASRRPLKFEHPHIEAKVLPNLSTPFDWSPLLQQCKAVVHLAGIAHSSASDDLYGSVNHRATEVLASAAFRCSTHLIFVSSILAQSGSFSDHELSEEDAPEPTTPYGTSKLAAERAIHAVGTSFTILRPVVIYGEGEKGNFATVHTISRLPIPLPFGSLTAKRSVLSVQNFCSAVAVVLSAPGARGETYIVSDPVPLTLPDIITRYRAKMGKRPPILVPLPEKWLELALKLVGGSSIWHRIGSPLVAKPNKRLALGWQPS